MNRQTILAAIHRQLRESFAETGEVRPLGEIVGSVGEEIRSARNGQAAPSVIPIESVAAFVDGNLSNEESEAICQAVMVDNSVLAELVAAVRAMGQPAAELEPLPEVLRNQLIAMQASLPVETATAEVLEELPIAQEAPPPTIRTEPVVRRSSARKPGRFYKSALAILSLAAALAAIIFVATRNDKQAAEQAEIVQNEPRRPEPVAPLVPDAVNDSGDRLVDSADPPGTSPEPVMPSIQPVPGPDPSPAVVQQVPPVKNDPPSIRPQIPEPRQIADSTSNATPLSGLRWTKVTGILTQRNDVATSSDTRVAMWQSVGSGASPPTASIGQPVVLRTLPLSRAEATLQSGGRIVLAADSGIEVSKGDTTASADVGLQYGDAALIDLPKGTVIRLIKAGHALATLRWQSKASAVLQHSAGGLDVHVNKGTIDINDQPQQDSSVTIARDLSIQSIPAPKRLPVWVDRPVETINVKQTFLAQIGESRNVMGTLNQQIRTLAQNPRASDGDLHTLATLATWQAALAGDHVFRMVGSPLPVVRMAAMNRVVMIPRWDPRHRRLWTAIENAVRNKQRATRFRRLIFLAQQNGTPSQAQINTMLEDLTAPDVASRAMSDYLLRRFHAKAKQLPNYDPTATGQAQLQAANLWRRYLGRPANATQRAAPAAVDRLRN